jgi:sulfopyruvate decarboxylase subunit beta
MKDALASDKMTIIVCKCESGNIPVPVIEYDAPVIKYRFMEVVRAKNHTL